MDKDIYRAWRLLAEIERDAEVTQRSLSKKLGIALGLTNACLKRLVKKGYVKVANMDRNRIHYLLTPQGIAEKARLTYEYLQYTIEFYKETRARVRDGLQGLQLQGKSNLVFYGAEDVAEIAYITLNEVDCFLAGVVDDSKVGESFFGHPILHPSQLDELDFDVVVVTSFKSAPKILERLTILGMDQERIYIF